MLDQWHLVPGDHLPKFMEQAVRKNDFVLIICTPRYKRKSDNRSGGAGYEGDIMTGEVLTERNHRKFIPILRKASWRSAAPIWLKAKYYIDLTGEKYSEKSYQNLLTTLLRQNPQAPPVGKITQKRDSENAVMSLGSIIKGLLVGGSGRSSLIMELSSPFFNEVANKLRESVLATAIDSPLYPPATRNDKEDKPEFEGSQLIMTLTIFLQTAIGSWIVEEVCKKIIEGIIHPALKKMIRKYKKDYEDKGIRREIGFELQLYYKTDNLHVIVRMTGSSSEQLKANATLISEAERKALDWAIDRGISSETILFNIKDGKLSNFPKLI